MEGHTPFLSLATEVLLTEDVDPPVQPVQLCPAARPGHGLLPALSQEGVEAGQGEDNLGQESHLAGLSPPGVQRDVAGLVQADLRSPCNGAVCSLNTSILTEQESQPGKRPAISVK